MTLLCFVLHGARRQNYFLGFTTTKDNNLLGKYMVTGGMMGQTTAVCCTLTRKLMRHILAAADHDVEIRQQTDGGGNGGTTVMLACCYPRCVARDTRQRKHAGLQKRIHSRTEKNCPSLYTGPLFSSSFL